MIIYSSNHNITINRKMPNKILNFIHLTRIMNPTGFLLAFFPASFGLMLASPKQSELIYLFVFLLGSILARSAGCIINDMMDQDIDSKVERTKTRPLASGAISLNEAMVLLAFIITGCLIIVAFLNETAIQISIIAGILIFFYPMMKRITYFPQVFLGFAFNTGALIGFGQIKDSLSNEVYILYIACVFWTIAFDSIYAFMDFKDDKKIGVKSTAILLEKRPYKTILSALYSVFFALFLIAFDDISGYYLCTAVLVCYICSLLAVYTLDIRNSENCLWRFKINNFFGFLIIFALVLEKL